MEALESCASTMWTDYDPTPLTRQWLEEMVTLKIEQYADTQDLSITIPHYVLQELNWKEGDELV